MTITLRLAPPYGKPCYMSTQMSFFPYALSWRRMTGFSATFAIHRGPRSRWRSKMGLPREPLAVVFWKGKEYPVPNKS